MNKDKTEYAKVILIARLRKWDTLPFWKFNSPPKRGGGGFWKSEIGKKSSTHQKKAKTKNDASSWKAQLQNTQLTSRLLVYSGKVTDQFRLKHQALVLVTQLENHLQVVGQGERWSSGFWRETWKVKCVSSGVKKIEQWSHFSVWIPAAHIPGPRMWPVLFTQKQQKAAGGKGYIREISPQR